MANKAVFATFRGMLMPAADATNHEGAPAYAFSPKHALAQYAATGCFGRTFYATADEQLARVLELCQSVDPEFVARVAIYARRKDGVLRQTCLVGRHPDVNRIITRNASRILAGHDGHHWRLPVNGTRRNHHYRTLALLFPALR